MLFPQSICALFVCVGFLPPIGVAAEPAAYAPPPRESDAATSANSERISAKAKAEIEEKKFRGIRSWSDVQLRTLYENVIVDPQDRHKFKVKPQPRVRDLISSDYSRLDLRMLYGFDKKFEGELALGNYVPSPRTDGDRAGISYIDAVVRYRWTPDADPTGKATVGIDVMHPLPNAPDSLTDGTDRYSVFSSYSRTSTRFKNFQEFFNLSYTVVAKSSAPGVIAEDEPQNDFFTVAVGELRNRGIFTYGVSVAWSHVAQGERADFVTLTPSVTIAVPKAYTLNCPGSWQLGMSWAVKHYESSIHDKFRVRVRWIVRWGDIKSAWNNRGKPASGS